MKHVLSILFFVSFSYLVPFQVSAQNIAIDFDGANDYIQTTYPGVLGSADRTFEAWVFVSTNAPASNLAILDYGLNAVGSRNTFAVSGNRSLTFISGGTNANISSPANAVPVGQWTHVAFVLDNGNGYLYVNGSQVGTGVLTTVNTPSGHQNLRIGQRVPGNSILFEGSIDEVRVFDYARSQLEIAADMNAEYCSIPSGLAAYYRLNDGIAGGANATNTSAFDESGNGNTGTLNNFALTGSTSNWVNGPVITSGASSSTLTISTCSAYTGPSGNNTWGSTGIYTDIIPNTSGCDSIITIDLTVNSITNSVTMFVCDSLISPSGNYVWNAAGIYSDTVQTTNGCDSILTITLGINSSLQTINPVACDTYTSPSGNNTWTTSGTYQEAFTSIDGCDSIIAINLTINSSTSSTLNETVCQSNYTSPSGNYVWNHNGTYQDVITNSQGCDSLMTIHLDFIVDPTITQNHNILTANETDANATYQWINCADSAAIIGETSSTFVADQNGVYAVTITIGNCTITSECIEVTTVNLDDVEPETHIQVYPNPSHGEFAIWMDRNYEEVKVRILDVEGKEVYQSLGYDTNLINIDTSFGSGFFIVYIQYDGQYLRQKIIIE